MSKGIEQLYSLKALAAEHIKQGRYTEGAVYLRDILSRFQHQAAHITSQSEMQKGIRELQLASRKNLSLCYLKLARYQDCIEQCRFVLEIEPNNVKVVYRIGRAYLELRQFDSAEHYLKRGFYLDSQEKEIMKALEEIEQLRQEAKRTEQAEKAKWSISGLFWWFLALVWAIMAFPYRTMRAIMAPKTPAKRE